MNPYTKAVLSVIRLAALGLIVVSGIYLGSYVFFAVGRKESGESALVTAWRALPLAGGVVLWIKARAIAERFTKDLDE